MLFVDNHFLFFFLPAALLLHRIALFAGKAGIYPSSARLCIFVLTVIFYGAKQPIWLLPFFVSVGFDFLWATLIGNTTNERWRKLWLFASLAQNLGLLGWFKYLSNGPTPPGISFYTFESLSFVIDVYRRDITCPKNPLEFFAFIGMFPRFIAGPIVRYKTMVGQFASYSGMRIEAGLFTFGAGYFLKSVFADNFALFVPYAFDQAFEVSFASAWLGVFAYGMQLYFDFYGYSLMAIGLGRCLGFEFPENFRQPYLATSLSDFWRRWHISLSSWMRDYLFNPIAMVAARRSKALFYFALWLTMVLIGFWHGPRWTYLCMGAWHGVFLCLENGLSLPRRVWSPVYRALVLWIVMLGWVFFRVEGGLSEAFRLYRALFHFWGGTSLVFDRSFFVAHPLPALCCLLGIVYCFFIEGKVNLLQWGDDAVAFSWKWARPVTTALLIAFSIKLDAVATTIPFLYFQF